MYICYKNILRYCNVYALRIYISNFFCKCPEFNTVFQIARCKLLTMSCCFDVMCDYAQNFAHSRGAPRLFLSGWVQL